MCRTKLGLVEYNQRQIAEMLGPVNMYFASLALGRQATREEAVWHYVFNGGPEDFRRRWVEEHAPSHRLAS